MKVILKQDVQGLGQTGEVHEVSGGYARNHLLPQNLAEIASPESIRRAEAKKQKRERQAAEKAKGLNELVAKLSGVILELHANGTKDGNLYGSVTFADICRELERQHSIIIPKNASIEPQTIKRAGPTKVVWTFGKHDHVSMTVTVSTGVS